MPRQSWSPKRERQYQHIKEGELERGEDEDTARGDRSPHREQGASASR